MIIELADDDKLNKTEVVPKTTFKLLFWEADAEELWKTTCVDDGTSGEEENGVADDETTFTKELNFVSELDEASTGDVDTDKRLVLMANEELNFISELDKASTGDVDADKWLVLIVDEELNFVSEVDESSTDDADTDKTLVLNVGKSDCCEDRDAEEVLRDCNGVDVANSGVLAIVWVNERYTSEDVNTVDVTLNEEETSCITELEFTTSVVDSSILVWNGVIEENGIEEDVMFTVQFRPVKLGGHVHV